jgi:hypothetical protein
MNRDNTDQKIANIAKIAGIAKMEAIPLFLRVSVVKIGFASPFAAIP